MNLTEATGRQRWLGLLLFSVFVWALSRGAMGTIAALIVCGIVLIAQGR